MLPGITQLYVFGITALLLSFLGVYGASKEKKWALTVFASGMTLIGLILFVETMTAIPGRKEAVDLMRQEHLAMLPLSQAQDSSKAELSNIQANLDCCGVENGYEDWGYDIPESCVCSEDSTNECVPAPMNSSLSVATTGEHIKIHKQPCLPILIILVKMVIDIILAVLMVLTLIWIVSAVLSIAILCQLKQKVEVPPVAYSAEAKSGNYTTLRDASENA
ncbi:tetraspanin-8-like isoform X2 [Lampris incognitus]|nr:tetraspanin-8-like isoform X2 [Lampris incognitus]